MVASLPSPTATQAVASPDFINVAKAFCDKPPQIKLIQWLQSSTGAQKQADFALMWRDGQLGGAIDFVKVFQSYQGLPHQNAALRWLQANTQAKTLEGFAKMWSDWNLSASKNQDLRLKVPYFQQVDNKYEPMRTCNTSSCAMVAKFLGAKISGDDEYYKKVIKYGDTTDHGAQTKALAELGIKSFWHTDLGFNDLDQSLEAGFPIVIGILHRGSFASPTGGHMIVVIGRTASQDYICHDPFGSILDSGGGYTGKVTNGNAVVYPRYILTRRWLPESNKSGWGRLFTK
ncbi:MAG: C39 family peptidase [Oscillatoriophycideae cyanobacterium NC_groundwater_1537_Pr4_S-0.65um_50_18]|nr:C39 family peptidase [Oscillatoriophycideae cyanobacterium NC_groundwater_1537_Pr4_S-0.65um_50_18]